MPMDLRGKHIKERIAVERAKIKALKRLQEEQAAIVSVFKEGDKIPLSILARLKDSMDQFTRDWSEEGSHYRTLIEEQKAGWKKHLTRPE
jgi:hypothetical protein